MLERLLSYAREGLTSLVRERLRTALTMLGMVIGTASVIAVFGISRAAATGIEATIASFGEPATFVQTDPRQTYPERAAIAYRDAAKIRAAAGALVKQVSPNFSRNYRVGVGTHGVFQQVVSTDGYAPADRLPMQEGRKIDERDVASAAHVCTLSADLAALYFGDAPAVGRVLKINGSRFTVVGVYEPISGNVFNSLFGTGTVAIPYTVFREFGIDTVDFLLLYPADPRAGDAATQAVVDELQRLHGPRAQYFTQNAQGALASFQRVLDVITAALSAVGAIAVLVAGIGTMNILLVSVAERSREIGLRRAVGASRRDIGLQFLIESVVLSLLGGGTGLAVGLSVTALAAIAIRAQLGAAIVPYLLLTVLAIVFSVGIGLAFGLYPAMRAARLDPIEALRS